MENMINLKKIKAVIFDFDDTLAIHKNRNYKKERNESEVALLNYYLNAYLNPTSFYETIEPCYVSQSLLELVKILRKNNVKMYCVSGMKLSFHFKAKEFFVHKYYGKDIEVFSSGKQELKLDAAKIISKLNNCNLNEVLFIDDMEDNISSLNKIGVNAILPEEVDTLIKNN